MDNDNILSFVLTTGAFIGATSFFVNRYNKHKLNVSKKILDLNNNVHNEIRNNKEILNAPKTTSSVNSQYGGDKDEMKEEQDIKNPDDFRDEEESIVTRTSSAISQTYEIINDISEFIDTHRPELERICEKENKNYDKINNDVKNVKNTLSSIINDQ